VIQGSNGKLGYRTYVNVFRQSFVEGAAPTSLSPMDGLPLMPNESPNALRLAIARYARAAKVSTVPLTVIRKIPSDIHRHKDREALHENPESPNLSETFYFCQRWTASFM
jgi:hypothetical protein